MRWRDSEWISYDNQHIKTCNSCNAYSTSKPQCVAKIFDNLWIIVSFYVNSASDCLFMCNNPRVDLMANTPD